MLHILPTEPSRVASLAFMPEFVRRQGILYFEEIADFYGTKQK